MPYTFGRSPLSLLNPMRPRPPRRNGPPPSCRYCVRCGMTLYTHVGEPGDISFLHAVPSTPSNVLERMWRATERKPETPVLLSKLHPSHVRSALPAPTPRLKCQPALRGPSGSEVTS